MSEPADLRELYDRGMKCPGAVHRDYEIFLDEDMFTIYGDNWTEVAHFDPDLVYAASYPRFERLVDDLIDEYESELLH